jgi:hypothetical protein
MRARLRRSDALSLAMFHVLPAVARQPCTYFRCILKHVLRPVTSFLVTQPNLLCPSHTATSVSPCHNQWLPVTYCPDFPYILNTNLQISVRTISPDPREAESYSNGEHSAVKGSWPQADTCLYSELRNIWIWEHIFTYIELEIGWNLSDPYCISPPSRDRIVKTARRKKEKIYRLNILINISVTTAYMCVERERVVTERQLLYSSLFRDRCLTTGLRATIFI